MTGPMSIPVQQEYDIPRARMSALKLARQVAMGNRKTHLLMTAVSELASNLCFHAKRGGTIRFDVVHRDGAVGIEVTVEDDGPGIPDLAAAMQDGFSTNGGLGSGLPGARRLMDEFEITSTPHLGTRIIARIWQW